MDRLTLAIIRGPARSVLNVVPADATPTATPVPVITSVELPATAGMLETTTSDGAPVSAEAALDWLIANKASTALRDLALPNSFVPTHDGTTLTIRTCIRGPRRPTRRVRRTR